MYYKLEKLKNKILSWTKYLNLYINKTMLYDILITLLIILFVLFAAYIAGLSIYLLDYYCQNRDDTRYRAMRKRKFNIFDPQQY